MNATATRLNPVVDAVLTGIGIAFFCGPAWIVVNLAARLSESDRRERADRRAQK